MDGLAEEVPSELRHLFLLLESQEDVLRTLEILNTLLATIPGQIPAQFISLPVIFALLPCKDPAQEQLTCSVLDKLLHRLPGTELVKHAPYLELGLQYPVTALVRTCLQALLHHSMEKGVREVISAPTMLHLIAQTMAGEDLECATLSSKILLQVLEELSTVVQPTVVKDELAGAEVSSTGALQQPKRVLLEEMGSLLSLGSVVRLRVYDWCVKMCLQGNSECCKIVGESGLLARLVRELEEEDILLKLNVIELLSDLAECQAGVAYIQEYHVLEKLHPLLQTSKDDVLGAAMVPGKG